MKIEVENAQQNEKIDKQLKSEKNSCHKQIRIIKHLQNEIKHKDNLYTEILTENGYLYMPSNLAYKVLAETFNFYSKKILIIKKQLSND
jgi:hypothetical protein